MAAGAYPSRATIVATQLEQLRSLVAELFPANRFYTRKLEEAGITFDVASLTDFARRFPFTTKHELAEDQRAHPAYGTNLTYPLGRYSRMHQTSGTRGTPLRWLDTPESWEAMLGCWREVFHAAEVGAADRILFAFSFGPFIGFWLAFEAAARVGALCLPAGGLGSEARLRMLLDNGATVLCCTPTYALRLAEVAAAEKIDLQASCVRRIIVAGEPGGSVGAVRERIERLWPGARVFDHHGMTEVGPVTFECPVRPGVLHVLENAHFAEIVDPLTDRPVPPGETGELVLTTLARTGSPVLRYRTGDLVVAEPRSLTDEPCACGRHELALRGGILGRTDDMMVVRGVNVYPSAVDALVRTQADVAEYRVWLTTDAALAELRIEIEPELGCPDVSALVRRVEKDFDNALSLRVTVTPVPPGTLPRFEMKAQRWVRTAG
jgi:phenylacetate-CoA ligase